MKISPEYKFSHNYSKGTAAERKEIAECLNEKIFNELLDAYSGRETIGIKELEQIYNKNLPEKKHIRFKHEKSNFFAGLFRTMYDEEHNLAGYRIILKHPKKNIPVKALPTIMHESMHYLETMLFPKTTLNDKEFYEHEELYDDTYKIYDEYFYNTTDPFISQKSRYRKGKRFLKKLLRYLDTEEKIMILKNIKNCLTYEEHAYGETKKYASKLKDMNKDYFPDHLRVKDRYLFTEKLEFIKSRLLKVFQKERAKNAMKYSKSGVGKVKGFAKRLLLH